jgi:riboflavin kinase/FMN adenylyltransferase
VLLAKAGIDHLVVVPFTESFSQLTAEEYITEFLVKRFHPHTIVIGYDHRFGQGRMGDYKLMERLSETYGYILKEIPAHVINENAVSSTLIRKAMQQGRPDTAAELLGYHFFFSGIVKKGSQLGRKLGYPTANLEVEDPEKLLPSDGIYAVYVDLENQLLKNPVTETDTIMPPATSMYGGMMSIGVRPTIDDSGKRLIEVNIFDFDGDVYDRKITVFVLKYLRPELKFRDLEELKAHIAEDEIAARRVIEVYRQKHLSDQQ